MPVQSFSPAKKQNSTSGSVGRIVFLSVSGIVCLIILLFLTAFLILQKDWSGSTLTILAYTCTALPAFFCGFLCAKTVSKRKALFGILSALPILLLIAILCLVFYGKIGTGFLIVCGIVLFFSALGSFLAVTRKKKRKYKKIGTVR